MTAAIFNDESLTAIPKFEDAATLLLAAHDTGQVGDDVGPAELELLHHEAASGPRRRRAGSVDATGLGARGADGLFPAYWSSGTASEPFCQALRIFFTLQLAS